MWAVFLPSKKVAVRRQSQKEVFAEHQLRMQMLAYLTVFQLSTLCPTTAKMSDLLMIDYHFECLILNYSKVSSIGEEEDDKVL